MQNLNKQLKNKIINKILELEKIQGGYQSFFPLIHIDDRNSLIISPYLSEVEDTSKVLLIDDCGKKLFFQYREIL